MRASSEPGSPNPSNPPLRDGAMGPLTRAAIAALNAFTHIIDAATAALIHAGQHRGNPGEK